LHVVQFTDVDGIKYVINFDYPNSSEEYVHRIGRTGRRNTTGTSYAFFTPDDSRQAKDLVSVLQEANQDVNPKLTELAKLGGGWYGKRSKYYIFLKHVVMKLSPNACNKNI
jgi:superfamily II DNA/RNA helicase